MTEKQLLASVIQDKIKECTSRGTVTYTRFLDVYEQSDAVRLLKNRRDAGYILWGGFEDSERKIIIFSPDPGFFAENAVNQPGVSPIVQLRVTKDRFSSLSHRDYLGALMGLGIRREMTGDIVLTADGCLMYVLEKSAPFICQNLTCVGRGTVRAEICSDFSEIQGKDDFREKQCFVPSMRADAVVAEAFGISRGTAAEIIKRGEVFINAFPVCKPDSRIKGNTKIVIHGRGRVLVGDDIQLTRKNRYTFKVKIY